MSAVAVVDMDLRLPGDPVRRPDVEPLDCYSLATTDLEAYAGLIVPTMVDQEYLHRHRERLRTYLDRGGIIAFSGQLQRPWLPGAGLFEPKQVRSFRDYELRIVSEHPVFSGVEASELTYRRGVAGFFARGYHRPPPGADILIAFTSGEPVVYVDQDTTGGTLLVHAGNNLLSLNGSTTSRVPGQLMAWIRDMRRGV